MTLFQAFRRQSQVHFCEFKARQVYIQSEFQNKKLQRENLSLKTNICVCFKRYLFLVKIFELAKFIL